MEKFIAIAPGVYRLEVPFPGCWTGVVLVRGTENILVDSGGCAETVDHCIVPALAELDLQLSDIHWMAMTHIHGDHVGGCARLRALAPHMGLAVFADSLPRMEDPLAYSREIRARFPQDSPDPPAVLEGVPPDRLLKDGDLLGSLRLLHTPGHDTDACCYLEENSGTLITGDSLQLNGTVSQGCALIMDADGYRRSLQRLLQMEIRNICAGHPYLPLGPGATGVQASRRYLQACLTMAARDRGFVRGMMAAGVTDARQIARALIQEAGGVEPAHLFLPLYTVTEYMDEESEI